MDSGLRDVGYNYVVLDDCWSAGRGGDGHLIVDTDKFPNGMKHISKELHDLGFLYGMYSSAGESTCARYEGSLDHEVEDAASLASWDVDYLKYDNLPRDLSTSKKSKCRGSRIPTRLSSTPRRNSKYMNQRTPWG